MSQTPHVSPFDAIRQVSENGDEYWSARELYKILGYIEWRNFNNVVIKRAMKACEEDGRAIADHFVRSYKAITGGKGAKQQVEDVLLSRYAAYLVVMNGDPKMPVVAIEVCTEVSEQGIYTPVRDSRKASRYLTTWVVTNWPLTSSAPA